jgi:hypothetical protein
MGTVGGVDIPRAMTVVVVDADQQPVLLAAAADELAAANGAGERICDRPAGVAYGLLVSPSTIALFNGAGRDPIAQWPTDILAAYHPDLRLWPRNPRALMALLEAWLSDVAYGWSGQTPPGGETFEAIGLAERLRRAGPAHVHPDED